MDDRRTILTGFAIAVILTAIPFGLVALGLLPARLLLWIIGGTAVAQIVVHLRFFLGIRLRAGNRARLGALVFACVLLIIMVGGTLWVMANLNYRMM